MFTNLDEDSHESKLLNQNLCSRTTDNCSIIGPKFPSNHIDNNLNENVITDAADTDEDDFGPALPPGFNANCQLDSNNSLEGENNECDSFIGPIPEGQDDKKLQYDIPENTLENDEKITKREKWMLIPPKELKKTLPTKSITKFSQSKSSKNDYVLTKEQKLELKSIAEKEEKIKEFLTKYEKVDFFLFLFQSFIFILFIFIFVNRPISAVFLF